MNKIKSRYVKYLKNACVKISLYKKILNVKIMYVQKNILNIAG